MHGNFLIRDVDIEDEDAVFEDEDEGSLDEENEALQKEHYVKVQKSRLSDDGVLKDQRYAGMKDFRKNLYGSDESEQLSMSEEENSQESEKIGSDWYSGSSDCEQQDITSGSRYKDIDIENEGADESEDEDEENDIETKRDHMAQLVKKEVTQAMKSLSQLIQEDAVKGYSIVTQSKFFENIIDVRIKLQKGLSATNQLPLTEATWNVHLNDKSKQLLKKARTLVQKVANQCVELRCKFQNIEKINQQEHKHDSLKKRKLDVIDKESQLLDQELKQYSSAVLNKWSLKISSSSGKAALNSSKFKALNQPADIQVKNHLADLPRLLKRTRLNRNNIVPIGFAQDYEAGKLSLLSVDDGYSENNENRDIPRKYDSCKNNNQSIGFLESPYLFDDEDFYRVLLNDLVDKKISNVQQGNGMQIAIISRSQNKIKKNTDTKASKARKLNYSVQEPLANYETPVSGGFKWSDEQIDELFVGLLGQKVNFNENTSEGKSDKIHEQIDSTKNDGIRIFG